MPRKCINTTEYGLGCFLSWCHVVSYHFGGQAELTTLRSRLKMERNSTESTTAQKVSDFQDFRSLFICYIGTKNMKQKTDEKILEIVDENDP